MPHRQFVFAFPKLFKPYFRHNRRLLAIPQRFYNKVAKTPVRTGMVLAYQSSGQFARWNPHWHGLFLEGGFDREGRFVHVPTADLVKMSACLRQRVIAFFLERKLLNERLAQYIVRPPVSLEKLLVEEGGPDTVVYRTADSSAPTGCTPLGLAAPGRVALTSFASLPRAGSPPIHPNHPSASVRPTSRSPSSRCRPSTAAPHGLP